MIVNTTDLEALASLAEGSRKLADLVRPGFGPFGRNTIYDQATDIEMIVNDGRQILPQVEFKDRQENTGAALVKKAGEVVGTYNGDGTIATILVADTLIQGGMRQITAGTNPMQLRKALDSLVEPVLNVIEENAVKADDTLLRNAAQVAADDEKMGSFVMDAYLAAKPDGTVTVVDSQEPHTRVEMYDGIRYEYGLYHKGFITDFVRGQAILQEPYILLLNQRVGAFADMKKILEEVVQKRVTLLIIAQDIDQPLLNILLANRANGALSVAVGKGPGFGETRRRNMEALAAKTGAVMIEENCGLTLSECDLSICGRVKRAVLDDEMTLLEGITQEDPEKVEMIRRRTAEKLENETNQDEIEKLQDTLNILSGKSAKIIAGGMVEYEMFEQKSRAESALAAIRSAEKLGVVAGGGSIYLTAAEKLKEMEPDAIFPKDIPEDVRTAAVNCMVKALTSLTKAIAENAGYAGGVVTDAVVKKQKEEGVRIGFDVRTGEYKDMLAAGVPDSADTACYVVQTAISMAGTVLTAGAVVYPPEQQ